MNQNELKQRLNNKNTLCKHLYHYTYNGIKNDTQCVFLPHFETDEENDEAGKELEEGLITYYANEHYKAYYKIEQFICDEQRENIFLNIISFYRSKVKDFITALCQTSLDEKTDYIFSFLPKNI